MSILNTVMQKYMSKIKIIYLSKNQITPYSGNARSHSAEQIEQIKNSIAEFGICAPIAIHDGVIVYGHARFQAMLDLGYDEFPTVDLSHLSNSQKKAYTIADNQIALNATWDLGLLKSDLDVLSTMDFDISLLGFDDAFLDGLSDSNEEDELSDEEAIPSAIEEPIARLGDIWQLGDHIVGCGDSTDTSFVDQVIAGADWDVCIFDPPYDIESIYVDAMPAHKGDKKLCVFWDYRRFAVACSAAVNAGWNGLFEFVWDNCCSWYVPNRPLARHKSCGVFGDDLNFNFDEAILDDDRNRIPRKVKNTRGFVDYEPIDGKVHLRTVEPIHGASRDMCENQHSNPIKWIQAIFAGIGGEIYLDLFGGSGTTLIACEKLGRKSYTIEVDPIAIDVILRRWQDYTGKDAIHVESNKSYNHIKDDHIKNE